MKRTAYLFTIAAAGHSMSDPAKYRTREEVGEKIRHDQDPIEQVRNRLLATRVSEQELEAIGGVVAGSSTRRGFRPTRSRANTSDLYTDVYR